MKQEDSKRGESDSSSPGEAQERVLPLRLDAETDHRLRTLAAVTGYAEGAIAKIAIRTAAEHVMELVRRTMDEIARAHVARVLGCVPGETPEDRTEADGILFDSSKGMLLDAQLLTFSREEAEVLLNRRRYLKRLGPAIYAGSDSDQGYGRWLFEPRAASSHKEAVRESRITAAEYLAKQVQRYCRQWRNLAGLREQAVMRERESLLAQPGFVRDMNEQAQALAGLIARIEAEGQITAATLAAAKERNHGDWVVATLQDEDRDDSEKLTHLRESLETMRNKCEGFARLEADADRRVEALKSSPAWNDAFALAEMLHRE